jgi:hypothetical protein
MMRASRSLLFDIVILLLITAASSAVAYHNVLFASPFDNPDIRAHQQNALEWIRNGTVPYRGQGTSYSGVGTPGTTFLMLPGVILFLDWRLQEIPGAVLLHAGTLLFLYFIVRGVLGRGTALAVVSIAGFSPLTGPTLWPNGHPFFVVGMLYFLIRWARDGKRWGLAAALLMMAVGVYVYPTIAPAMIAIPIIWLLYRPPISGKVLAAALGLAVLVWAPFLYYEVGRDFSDITSMVMRKDAGNAGANLPTYCFAAQIGEADQIDDVYVAFRPGVDPGRVAYPGGSIVQSMAYRACVFFMHIDQNFDSGWFFWPANETVNRILYGIFLLGVSALLGAAARGLWDRWSFWRAAVPLAVIGSVALWFAIQPDALSAWIAHEEMSRSNLRLVLEQARIIVPLVWCGLFLGVVAGAKSGIHARTAGALFVCIVGSCLMMAILVEPDRPWRFWWLWPLQSIGLVAGVICLTRVLSARAWIERAALLAIIIGTFPLAHVQTAIAETNRNGFGGLDSGQMTVLAFLADAARTRHAESLSVGVVRFPAEGDPTRPGGWLDFGLHYSYGIENRNTSDPAPGDDFRLEDFRQGVPADSPHTCIWDGWKVTFQSARILLCAPEDR